MIIERLLDILFSLVTWFLSLLNIPQCPPELINVLDTVKPYIFDSIGILGVFVDWPFMIILLSITINVIIADWTYKIVMWVLRKIPVAGIE